MNEIRKTILIAITISLLVGTVAGATGGFVVAQLARDDLGQFGQYVAKFIPSVLRRAITPDASKVEEVEEAASAEEKQAPRPPATDEEAATIEAVRKVSPAVVSIVISKEVAVRSTSPQFPEELFREFGLEVEVPQAPTAPAQKRQVGGGSGFIISADGLVVTNKHVAFDDQATYTVITQDGKRHEAKILARDPFIDLALLKIEAKGLPTVKLGNSDTLRLGETVIAIGNALSELSNTITKGVVSGINRRVTAGGPGIGSEVLEEAIQTDAAINPGNSGGPLINLRGEVVGINTATSRAGQLIGFAIPINQAKSVIESVRSTGRIVRPWMGVRYVIINSELKERNRLTVDYGALIVRGEQAIDLAVAPGSPADKAGLKENDIILEIDGVKITEDRPLAKQIQKHKPGDTVTLTVLSQGKEKEVQVVLEELKQ